MKTRKNNFNLLFIFLSLSFRGHPGIVWSTIPGLSICGESPLTIRALCIPIRYFPFPLGIVPFGKVGTLHCGELPLTIRAQCSAIIIFERFEQ